MLPQITFRCLGVGEILWDLLPSGKQIGGAPANFAYHARALGMDSAVVTRVGNDQPGKEMLAQLQLKNLSSAKIQVDEVAPTGTVSIELIGTGVPQFTIHKNVAWDRLEPQQGALAACREADAICFGTLAQRCEPSRRTIQRLVAATPAAALRIFDINLREPFYSREVIEESLILANVLKLNDGELKTVSNMFGFNHSTEAQIQALAEAFELQLIALTRGPDGSLLYSNGKWSDQPGITTNVNDTVGAGDSFTAALAVGRLLGLGLSELNTIANEVASYVCSCPGAMPALPDALRQKIARPATQPRAARPAASMETASLNL